MFGQRWTASVVGHESIHQQPEETMSITTTNPELANVRARNESTWRASALALYAGDIESFLAHWSLEPCYSVAYPVDGLPSEVRGRDQLRALFSGFTAAAQRIDVTDVHLHQTDDPDVVFVEEHMVADLHDGSRYENDVVIRVVFQDGLLHQMHEYYGQVAHQQLADRLTAQVQA